MPATRRASAASRTEQHPCLFLPEVSQTSPPCASGSTPLGVPNRMKAPTTSYPSRSKSAAATELSTPPLIATTTFGFEAIGAIVVGLMGWFRGVLAKHIIPYLFISFRERT